MLLPSTFQGDKIRVENFKNTKQRNCNLYLVILKKGILPIRQGRGCHTKLQTELEVEGKENMLRIDLKEN